MEAINDAVKLISKTIELLKSDEYITLLEASTDIPDS